MASAAQSLGPITAVAVEQSAMVLPRHTPVYLSLSSALSTKDSGTKKGNTFTMSVKRDVLLGGYVVIPRGSKAVGSIFKRTRKGGFGKSGKLDISFDYIEVGDHRIPIEGKYHEAGEGNSTATIATFVFLSMIGSGLITGHSAEIPAGQEFNAWTTEDQPVRLPSSSVPAGTAVSTPALMASAPINVITAQVPAASPPTYMVPRRRSVGNSHLTCVTC
jgi:hypothetical protein